MYHRIARFVFNEDFLFTEWSNISTFLQFAGLFYIPYISLSSRGKFRPTDCLSVIIGSDWRDNVFVS